MILPPQRGHERPRVVRRSTSITLNNSLWLSTSNRTFVVYRPLKRANCLLRHSSIRAYESRWADGPVATARGSDTALAIISHAFSVMNTHIFCARLISQRLAGFAMSKSNDKDGAKNRNWRHEQHQDADVEISHKV